MHRAAVWPQACMLSWRVVSEVSEGGVRGVRGVRVDSQWRVVSECPVPALAAIPTETEAAPLMS